MASPVRRGPSALALALALVAACSLDASSEPPDLAVAEQEMAVCADESTVYGIDVSRFQGAIDWQLVKNSGVVYAYIQISRSLTDIDARFDYNWERAKAVGILRGAYQRFQPGQDVIGQAELFLEKLGPFQEGDLPPMLDVEDDNGLAPAVIAERVRQWIDHVEPVVGVKPVIYTGYYFWRDKVAADFSEYPLWIANYSATCPLVPPAWTRWAFHQYSSTATIPGITANTVDVNRFNGTLAELQALGEAAVCGDGRCNGAEDADSCPGECAPCQRIEAAVGQGDVVDETSACFETGGPAVGIRIENAGYGSSLEWTHATDAAAAENFARWKLYFAEAGRYRVDAFTPAPYNESRQTTYRVTHAGTETAATIDQRAVDGWNLVGEFEFAAGGRQSIQVDDNTGEATASDTMIVFDALRFTRVGDRPPGDDEASPPGTDASGGCSASGAHPGWLVLLVGVPLRRKPRINEARSARARGRWCPAAPRSRACSRRARDRA